MVRLNDIILLLVIFLSMLAGVLLPRFGSLFQPYVLHFMMFFLFLSFLSIKIDAIWYTMKQSFWTILLLSFLKTIALPIGVYFLFRVICPACAIAALLLSGISTGVVAPFISNLLRANSPLVLVMVVVTSLVVPFTLPAMIHILVERSIELSITPMIRMLSLVIFVPILAVETLRRLRPSLIKKIMNRQFPVSLVTFSLINLGVFSQYAEFFYQKPSTILVALFVAVVLSAIYLVVGVFSLAIGSLENQLAAGISLGNINNVLIIVFSSEFFGPLEPTVAAMYMVPFFGFILPLRIYRHFRMNKKPHR